MAAVAAALAVLVLSTPALADVNRSGIGAGVTFGAVDSDASDEGESFTGATVFIKAGFSDAWGLLFSYRRLESEDPVTAIFGENEIYEQLSVHAVRTWRADKVVRPHLKFGLARTEFETENFLSLTASDDGVGASLGGGFEAGTQRVAFLGDVDYSLVELFGEDFLFVNLTAGIIFKF